MEYKYISPSAGIDCLCPQTLPCECGSGSYLRGGGHSDYCQLADEAIFDPREAAQLPDGKKEYFKGVVVFPEWHLISFAECVGFDSFQNIRRYPISRTTASD